MNIRTTLATICATGLAGLAFSAAADSPMAEGGDKVYLVNTPEGCDWVHVFSKTGAASTFRNVSGKALDVRYLAVGGGGCGGSVVGSSANLAGGGGGGGGGVCEAQRSVGADEIWSVRVGKGSSASSGWKSVGTQGGSTVISNALGQVVLVPGGGYGGNVEKPGAGAAGGGPYGYLTAKSGAAGTYTSVTLLGGTGPENPAGANNKEIVIGDGTTMYYWLAGGGGGAGSAGGEGDAATRTSGAGGAGLPCDITGEVRYYGAGGGGGGCKSSERNVDGDYAIRGGAGGEGGGAGGTFEGDALYAGVAGTDGLGAGGGGGLSSGKAKTDYPSAYAGKGGNGVVVVRYRYATWNVAADTPAFASLGAAGEVTFRCSGETEADGEGKLWLKPGVAAVLAAVDAGGNVLAGWEDDETGEFVRGDIVTVTPASRRSYTAVFGKPWTADTTAKTLTNGDWTFKMTSAYYVWGCTQAAADGILNLATPIYNTAGKAVKIAGLGNSNGDEPGNEFIVTNLCRTVRLFLPDSTSFIADRAWLRHYVFGSDTSAKVCGAVSIPRNMVIAQGAFINCTKLEKLFFEGGAEGGQTMPYWSGFENCTSLARVSPLPMSATEIAPATFRKCAFTSIEMPGTTSVKARAFDGVPLTNVVFSTNAVTFGSQSGVYGDTIFSGADTACRYRFPGKAPVLEYCGTMNGVPYTGGITNDSGRAVWGYMFGKNSGVRLHGSWRADPDGWKKILGEIGSADWSGKTPPALDTAAGDRKVKGIFYWSRGTNTPRYGWLIDTAMPGEPKEGGMLLFVR